MIIDFFSIPRDLYYNGRKINSYYKTYGAEKLTEIISLLSGLDISGYIIIDMFAFIDVINILDGIDVELSEDLVDPTYKVRNNGKWSTLYYRKGTHHVNGVEALRIARARHFTPVFSRDSRQQKILISVKDRFREIGIGDLNKVLDIFKTLLSYIDTNMNMMEIFSLYNKINTIDTIRQNVLSTENVLDQTYSNLLYLGKTEDEVDDDFYKGAWILVPKDNDWDELKYYINCIIEGNKYEQISD